MIPAVNPICGFIVVPFTIVTCTYSIMFPFFVSGLKIVPNMWHLVPFVEHTQPLEDSKHFLISPHNHHTKSIVLPFVYYYPSSDCRTIEVVLYKIQVMTHFITYVEVILLQYNHVVFSTILCMSIVDMDHYYDLV